MTALLTRFESDGLQRVVDFGGQSLKSLKQSLRREWNRLSPDDLRPIAKNFKSRLGLCIAAKGWHFETT